MDRELLRWDTKNCLLMSGNHSLSALFRNIKMLGLEKFYRYFCCIRSVTDV